MGAVIRNIQNTRTSIFSRRHVLAESKARRGRRRGLRKNASALANHPKCDVRLGGLKKKKNGGKVPTTLAPRSNMAPIKRVPNLFAAVPPPVVHGQPCMSAGGRVPWRSRRRLEQHCQRRIDPLPVAGSCRRTASLQR